MKATKKPPTIRDRLMSEHILLGGVVLTRLEATARLQAEEVPRGAIDRCVFGVKPLSDAELVQFVRTGLVFALRCRVLGIEENNGTTTNGEHS